MSRDQTTATEPCGCMGWPIDIVWRDRDRCEIEGYQCSRCGSRWAGKGGGRPIANLDLTRKERRCVAA